MKIILIKRDFKNVFYYISIIIFNQYLLIFYYNGFY